MPLSPIAANFSESALLGSGGEDCPDMATEATAATTRTAPSRRRAGNGRVSADQWGRGIIALASSVVRRVG